MTPSSDSEWTDQDERLASIEDKLNESDAKFEKLFIEIRCVGIAVLVVAAMVFFDWPK